MIEIEIGAVPELAVTATDPSGLNANPNGCGATSTDRPEGVIKRPLGITVSPDLLIFVYWLPEGDETTFRFGDAVCPNELPIVRQNRKTKILFTFMAICFFRRYEISSNENHKMMRIKRQNDAQDVIKRCGEK
jgi:hypothetical protein